MAVIRIDLEGRDEVSRNIRGLRERMIELNRTIAENRNRLVGANAEEAKRIRALNQANAALKANISVEMQELRLKQQIINETNREVRAREQAARAAARQAEQSRQAALDLSAGVGMAAGLVARELGQLTAGFVRSAAQMETFRATIQAVTGDADETNRVLQELLDLSVELVGIDTGDLIQFSARLMAAGLSAAEARDTIRGVTERVAEQGKGAAVTTRVLEQLSQAINSNQISAQDFRPILRELPTLFRDASNALGQPIQSLEDFRNAADNVGGPTQAIILLVREMARASEGADLSTLNSQLDILSDQSRVLQAELGQHLIPAIVSIVMQINDWIEAFNDLDDGTQRAIAYGAALATGLAALTAVISGTVVAVGALSASLAAITGTAGLGGVATLAGQAGGALGRVVPILGRVASVGGLAVTAITTLTEAWTQIYNAFNQSRPFEDAQESITDFNVAASETARSLGLTADSLSGLSQEARTEIELLSERADQLRTNIRNAINRGDTEGARAFREEYRQINAQLTELTANLPQVATETEAVTESLAEQFVRSADQVIRLRDAFRTVSEGDDIQAIETAASNLTSALERELALQLMDAELTAADRLDLELSTARAIEGVNRDAQQRISQISQDRSDEEVAAAERQRDARIESAERARAAEVAGFERARDSGASYAEQLAEIGSVAQRRAFVAIVERLQDQGLSLDEARERAAQFIPILATLATEVNTADHAFGNFASTLVRDADRSADAVADLTRNVIALGAAISENLQTDETFIGFGRDITGRATGTTIESDQQRAGQQGRDFILQNFPDQAAALGITPQTFAEGARAAQMAERANQDYIRSLNSVVGAIDELTPVIEGIFDIDISSPRSGGHLALDAVSGLGQVLSGDVLGGAASLIRSFYEFGQPDAEALAQQHQQALARERQRVANIQAELDTYDRERESLFAARLDFLRSGESTFSDWTDTLQSFSDNDLVRGRQVFSEFSRAMNALNDEVNAARLGLVPLASSAAFTTLQRITAGRPSFGAQLDAPVDAQEAGVVQTIGGVPVDTPDPIEATTVDTEEIARILELANRAAERISDNTLSRSIRTSTETLNDLISAGNSVVELQAYINQTLVPLWNAEYDEMVQDLVDQGHTLEDAQGIVSSEFGTRTEFTTGRISAIIDPITERNQQIADQVAERVSDGSRGRAIRTATDTLNDMVQAGASVADLQAYISETLVPLWEADYDDLIDDLVDQGFTLEQAQAIVSAEHGTRAEFIGNRTSAIIDPITEANAQTAQQVAEIVSDGMRSREIRTTTDTLNDMVSAGASVADLLAFINTTLVPLWGEAYDDMVQDMVDQGRTLEDAEAIISAEHGTREEFIGGRVDAIITPIAESNEATARRVAEIVSDNQLATSIRTSTDGLNDLISAGASVADLQSYINTELVPLWNSEYTDMIDDLVDQGYTLEQATQIVESQHGTREAFIRGRTDAIITPIVESNEATAQQVAERVSDGSRGRAIRNTTQTLNDLVAAGASIADAQTYINTELIPLWQSQYQDMIDDLVDQGFTLEQAQAIVSAEHGTSEEFVSGLVSDVLSPIRASRQASATRNARGADRFGIRQARFNLGGATSEEEFDALFGILTTAVDTFYDNEEQRIRDLGLSVEETNQLLAENDLNRREELRGLSRITNTFAEQRIRDAEQVAEAEERAEQDRLRRAMRIEMELEGLREEAVEAEANRLERIEDLHLRHNRRLVDLEVDLSRDLEDEQRRRIDTFRDISLGYARSVEDLQNRIARRLFDDAVSFDDLTPEQRERVLASTEFRRGSFDLQQRRGRSRQDLAIESGILTNPAARDFYEQRILSGELTDEREIERLFGRRGLADFIGNERGIEDADLALQEGIKTANETSAALLGEIDTKLGNIDTTLAMPGAVSIVEPIPESAGGFGGTGAVTPAMAVAGAPVETRMMMAGEPVTPQMMQAMNVSISAQNVVVHGENMSGEVNARITNPEDVSPDITVELTDD